MDSRTYSFLLVLGREGNRAGRQTGSDMQQTEKGSAIERERQSTSTF